MSGAVTLGQIVEAASRFHLPTTKPPLHTTLRLCREHQACGAPGAAHSGQQYPILTEVLGPAWGDDTPIPLTMLLDIQAPGWNGASNTAWALRATPPEQATRRDFVARVFACQCAEQSLPLYESGPAPDFRQRYAVEVACQYAYGLADDADIEAAYDGYLGIGPLSALLAAYGDAARGAARAYTWRSLQGDGPQHVGEILRRILVEEEAA